MKLLSLLFLFAISSQINWEPNFENAKKIALDNHKLILLNFSGSDWCGPCIVTRKNYFENDYFTSMANENLVLVNADFPRKEKNKLSNEIVLQNNKLAEKYDKEGYFPKTLLLTSDGKILKVWQGKPENNLKEFTEEIKIICAKNK